MLAYTCKNQDCQQYLIGGIALCKVISAEGEVSLDSEEMTYRNSDEKPFSGDASCFHCGSKALKMEFSPEDIAPDSLGRMIDDLDSEIESVMKILGVGEE